MRWFYASGYDYGRGLPGQPSEVHGFVLSKPSRIREELLALRAVSEHELTQPEGATEADFADLHEPRVLRNMKVPPSTSARPSA